MKKNPGRKNARQMARATRRENGKKKMKINEWRDKKDRQLEKQL